MKSALKWHNKPGKKIDFLESLETTNMEVIFRSDDWDLVVKENSVLPQRKQARRKCMVVRWLLAHMSRHLNCACMRRGGEGGVQHFYW